MRGMGGGQGRVKAKFILISAWLSFLLSIVGGTAIAGTWLGTVIAWIAKFGGWIPVVSPAAPVILLIGGLVLVVWDCALDNVPNQVSIAVGILAASVARAVSGWVGSDITRWCNSLMVWVGHYTGPAIGMTAGFGLAGAMVVASVIIARRTVAKAGGAA